MVDIYILIQIQGGDEKKRNSIQTNYEGFSFEGDP
jgi:hypothetical protein